MLEAPKKIPTHRSEADVQIALAEITSYGQAMLRDSGLTGWRFKYDRAARRPALLSYREKELSVSYKWAQTADEKSVKRKVVHLVAAAVVGWNEYDMRSESWANKVRALGGDLDPVHVAKFSKAPYIRRCDRGCFKQDAFKRSNRVFTCAKCKGMLRYHANN
jgi:hypothetical protein